MDLKIIYKKLGELKDYENNPRRNDRSAELVAESIREYGFNVPVLIDKNDTIISGHTRKKAAEMLGMEKIPCIYIDNLSAEKIREFRLVDNKTSEFASWDYDKLIEELTEIENENMSKAFDFPDINNLDIDVRDEDFLQDTEIVRQKEQKKVKCPHCGKEFEV